MRSTKITEEPWIIDVNSSTLIHCSMREDGTMVPCVRLPYLSRYSIIAKKIDLY